MRLTLVLLFVSILTCPGNELAIGRWEGSVKIPERELKLIVDLAQDSGGAWIGSIIIPGLDVKGAALGDIAVTGSEVSFAIKSALGAQRAGPAKFKARATNATLVGDFMQGGNTAPFTLKKTGPPQVELPPRVRRSSKSSKANGRANTNSSVTLAMSQSSSPIAALMAPRPNS